MKKQVGKGVLPLVGASMVAGAAVGMMMMPKKKKMTMQNAAGKAIKAVGEAVENFSSVTKM